MRKRNARSWLRVAMRSWSARPPVTFDSAPVSRSSHEALSRLLRIAVARPSLVNVIAPLHRLEPEQLAQPLANGRRKAIVRHVHLVERPLQKVVAEQGALDLGTAH